MKSIAGSAPFFDSIDEIVAEIKSVLQTGEITQGKFLKNFESEFSGITGAKYSIGVSSGGTGLELILKALQIQEKEIIVPTNTFIASASSVIQSGGKVAFADIDKETLTLNTQSVKKLINDRTAGIMMVYMFGIMPENIDELKSLCKSHDLLFIEDASHAHGASYRGTMAGNIGDAACFSLYATKIITTGEGGMISTNRQDIYEKIKQLRNYGKSLHSEEYEFISNNYRLAEIPSLLGCYQLKSLEKNIAHRNKIAKRYIEELKETEELQLLKPCSNSINSFWRFPLYLDKSIDRGKLQISMGEKYNIRITWMYEPLCHLQPLFKNTHNHCEGDFPVAEECMKRLICLPTHLGIDDDDTRFICTSLKKEIPLCK